MVQPASTVTVRSAQACSMTRLRFAVESITSVRRGGFPQSDLVPPPRGITDAPSSLAQRRISAASSSEWGSTMRTALESLRDAGDFQRVRLVFARSLTAEARCWKHFGGIRQSQGIEGTAQLL